MTNRETIANQLGCASIFCSLAFWICAAIFLFTPLNHSEEVLHVMVAFKFWILLWCVGFLLALAAAWRGSRRWAFAALLPLASFGVAIYLASTVEW